MPPARPAPAARRDRDRLLGATLALLVFGAISVYSASSSEQILQGESSGGFLARYLLFGAVGLLGLAIAARGGVALVRRLTGPAVVGALALCLLASLPGLGREVNGARRWLGPDALAFQPSELAKVALVALLALALARPAARVATLRDVRGQLLAIASFVVVIGGLQRDLGTALVLAGAGVVVLVVAGLPVRKLLPLGAAGAGAALVLILLEPYRMARIATFLNPWADATGTGYQATQGQIALGSGGLVGNGISQSVQKAEWLPEAHTDFILAIVGEETGALGVTCVLVLYGVVAYSGLRIADRARTRHERLLATGITAIVLVQAVLNVWVVLGLFPLTGVPLPFVSYGSTNLIVLLFGVGLLLDVARDAPHLAAVPDPPDPGPGARAPRHARSRTAAGPRRVPRPAGRPTPAPTGAARSARADVRDRGRRDGRARRAGAGGRRRAA